MAHLLTLFADAAAPGGPEFPWTLVLGVLSLLASLALNLKHLFWPQRPRGEQPVTRDEFEPYKDLTLANDKRLALLEERLTGKWEKTHRLLLRLAAQQGVPEEEE